MPNYRTRPVKAHGTFRAEDGPVVAMLGHGRLSLPGKIVRKLRWRDGEVVHLRVENGRLVAFAETAVTKEDR